MFNIDLTLLLCAFLCRYNTDILFHSILDLLAEADFMCWLTSFPQNGSLQHYEPCEETFLGPK